MPAEAASLETASATGNRLPRFSSKDKGLVYTTFAADELGLWANRRRKDGPMDKYDPALFPLGRKIVSKNALAVLGEAEVDPNRLFECHAEGDWGVIESKSWYMNRMAIDSGYGCVASAYMVLGEVRVAILTLADRSNTLMALSDEMAKLLGGRPP